MTALSKIGALFLICLGVLIIIAGLLVIIGGSVVSGLGTPFGNAFGGAIAIIGIIIAGIGILQLLAGIFAWRGAGVARVLGVIFGLLFGLIGLAGALSPTTDPNTGVSTSAGPVGWIVTIGYLYTAAVFIFAWRRRA